MNRHADKAVRLLGHLPTHGHSAVTGYDRAEALAAAQVHATLALVRAVLLAAGVVYGGLMVLVVVLS